MAKPKRQPDLQEIEPTDGEARRRGKLLAQAGIKPEMRHSRVARDFINDVTMDDESEWKDTLEAYLAEGRAPPEDKLLMVSRMLANQAITLDAIFTNMAQRAAANIGQYPEAVDHYMRHALKAQAGSRASLEALARLHQPREQIVKHVNVNEGGQAVFANQIHQNGGKAGPTIEEQPSEEADEDTGSKSQSGAQPHVQRTRGPALLGKEPTRQSVPVPRDEGQKAMPPARRNVARGPHRPG